MQAAKESRERVGVDLYGFQRNLAKLQEALEEAQQNYATIAAVRQQAEQQLEQMREALEDELQLTKQDRSNVRANINAHLMWCCVMLSRFRPSSSAALPLQ